MSNVSIAYILSFLWRSWFWLGIWIFYYLKFTDYAGIGFLEAVMITTATIGEIPTGAIADMVGKKKAVIVAFVISGIGNLAMAFAPSYEVLLFSIITMTLGGCFYSGSLEALVYDGLKQEHKEGVFDRVVSRMNTMQNLGMAISGAVGGYLYTINNSLPFIMVAVFYALGAIVAMWLVEPAIDTEKYSWRAFVSQNRAGFAQLFNNVEVKKVVIALLIPSAFMVATENVLSDATAVELGLNSVQLGIYASVLFMVGVVFSENTERILKLFRPKMLYLVLTAIYLLTLMLMPAAGLIVGISLLFIRYAVQTVYDNFTSVRLNSVIESRYRATTLSTYSLIRNIPYVIFATGIGMMMNLLTAKTFSLYFGVLLTAVLLFYAGITRLNFSKK
jgi:MFS family permease